MKALVDTDILSELLRRKNALVRARAEAHRQTHGAASLSISSMTIFEIVQGWHRVGRPEQAARYLAKMARFRVLPFEKEVATLAGHIGGELTRRGLTVGVADACIAATALVYGRVLVTGNTEHYERVRAAGFALDLENWR